MAGPNYTPPELYDITVPDLFTQIAQEYPQRDIVQIIRELPDKPTDSLRITWGVFIQQAQNAAAELRARLASSLHDAELRTQAAQPRKPGSPPVVAGMLGANGYEYYVNLLACSLNRWTALNISPKNSPAAIEHLLRTSNASILVVDPSGSRIFHQSIPGMVTLSFASLEPSANGPAPPLTPLTQEQVRTEMDLPAFYMHTSGSTGHPKTIPWSHRFFLEGARARQRDGPADIGVPFYTIPPLFHAMGMFAMGMFVPAHANLTVFISSPMPKPPSATALLSYIPFMKGCIVALPPSILEELYALGPEAVKTVAEGTTMVIYAGAPLKKVIGAALLAAGVNVITAYGTTELGPATRIYRQNPEDWEYVEFRETYDLQFLPVDESDARELIIGPAEDCPAVINNENPHGYATYDVWAPHPSKPRLWKHLSRKGDVTVLSNGEKSDNKQIEGLLLQDKRILYVQVFGVSRPLNGVILQPSDPFQLSTEFLSQIQPTVDHANSVLPRHSRLVPELIIVASQDKPFATTDKGTVKAKETLDRYENEITSGYAALEDGTEGGEWAFTGNIASPHDVKEHLRNAVNGLLDKNVPDTADLFEQGLDSLLAIRLRTALLAVIKNTPRASQLVPRTITYTFPTIDGLTGFLLSFISPDKTHPSDTSHERILRSIAKFSSDFVPHKPGNKIVHGSIVALTGSTGSLGCSLLELLLKREDILKIYLLNRKGSTPQNERQRAGFRNGGLDPGVLDAKKNVIVYLDIDLSRRDLGLSKEAYEEVRDKVTHIIHAAWDLNFNLILESYERVHIAGVRHLVDLALSSPQAQTPRLTFLSSIAAAGAYRGPSQMVSQGEDTGETFVPEEPIDDPSITLDQGYGQGKYVSERLLVGAVQAGLRTTILRVTQLSGVTTNGAWSLSVHVPIVFRSSIALGMIPSDFPPVRWVPSDVAASVILKQTFGSRSALEYFHVENPVATRWEDIAQAVSDASPSSLRLVSAKTWLEHIAAQDVDVDRVPAVRLLDFFQAMAQSNSATALGLQRSLEVAPELAVGPVTPQLIARYVKYQVQNMSSGGT